MFVKTEATILHTNSETNPFSPIISVVCKYLRHVLGIGFGVATLPVCYNIESGGEGGARFISVKWSIPEFP